MKRLSGSETRQLLDPRFPFLDFLLECLGVLALGGSQPVFESLETRFFDFFFHLGFPDVLTFLDVLAIYGDGTDAETLRNAKVARADLFIASTNRDEIRLVACGTAKALGNPFTIARVKRIQFLETWQQQDGAFGVDFMVCTDQLTARAIVDVIGLLTARAVDTFADGTVQMAEFEIPADSPVADLTVAEADTFETLTFAAILRGGEVIIPSGGTVISPADDVVVIGTPGSIRSFASDIAPTQEDPTEIVIVGGSEIGYQTARLLEQRSFRSRLIERDPDRAQWLAERLQNTLVLEAEATDLDFLDREQVGRADVFIATLDNDQQNLLATLLANRLGAERTVAVVDTVAFSDLFEAVGVDVAVSPREATAEEITRFTWSRRAENVSIIERDRAEVVELEVGADSPATDRSIRDIATEFSGGVVIGAITRNGEFVTPRGDTVIHQGDHVVVFIDRLACTAEEYGISVDVRSEAWTSQECPQCGSTERTTRTRDTLTCPCGFEGHADLTASETFLRRQTTVARPMARPVRLKWDDHNWSDSPRSVPNEERTNPQVASVGR